MSNVLLRRATTTPAGYRSGKYLFRIFAQVGVLTPALSGETCPHNQVNTYVVSLIMFISTCCKWLTHGSLAMASWGYGASDILLVDVLFIALAFVCSISLLKVRTTGSKQRCANTGLKYISD